MIRVQKSKKKPTKLIRKQIIMLDEFSFIKL